jgi:hypothetical protein
MKRTVKIYIISICMLIGSAISFLLICLLSYLLPKDNFNLMEWKTKSTEVKGFVQVYHDCIKISEKNIDLRIAPDNSQLLNVLAVCDNKIYTVRKLRAESKYFLTSIDLSGADYRVLYESNMNGMEEACVNNNEIWWKEEGENVQYDLMSLKASKTKNCEHNSLENPQIYIDYENDMLIFADDKHDKLKEITFEEFTKMSDKSKQLLNISETKTWNGKSCAQDFFQQVYCFDENIYIVGQIKNQSGEAIALVFQYCCKQKQFEFVDYYDIGDGIQLSYKLIPCFNTD